MQTLSLCMIVKNEEYRLKECLTSAKPFVDEIVIVDTGSADSTKEVAKEFNAKIYDFAWVDDFSKARNFSLSKAKSDWILVLDADEIINGQNFKAIKDLISRKDYDAYTLQQINYTNNKAEFGFKLLKEKHREFIGFIPCNIIRLFRNKKKIFFSSPVHESVDKSISDAKFKVATTDLIIHHYQDEKGDVAEKQRRYMKIYESTLESSPNKAKAHRDLGILYSNFKPDQEKAIFHFKESLKYNPKSVKTYVGLGFSLLKTGRIAEAKETFLKAIEIHPSESALYIGLANANVMENNYRDAIVNFNKALKLGYPNHAEIKDMIGRLETELSNPNYR